MHPAAKLIVGLIIALAGLYWYLAGWINPAIGINVAATWIGFAAISALKTVFIGIFGLFLIFVGLIIAWIEWEDLKWEMKEKKAKKNVVVEEKPVEKKTTRRKGEI
jgi:hypothetical protein